MSSKETGARYRAKARAEVIAAYGGRCIDCGNQNADVLEFDHIEGGGNAHRHELFNRGHASPGGWHMAVKLRQLGFPPIIALRCTDCHTAKHPGRGDPRKRRRT